MKHALLALSVAVVAAATLQAADVTGTWSVDGDVYANPVKFSCALKQDGEALTGTATMDDGKSIPVTGTVKESDVTFEYDVDHEGSTYHLVFTGTLGDDGGMKGTIAVAGVEGTFTATRTPAE